MLAGNFPDLFDLQPLGEGSHKQVFSATHPTHGDVVLKVLAQAHDPESIRREILAVNQVDHNRVPPIFDVGQLNVPNLGNCVWFIEKRIRGRTLRQMIATGPLSSRQLLTLGLHVLEALVSAERAKIVHRDVKPDNIICDENDHFWLLDFGIARHLGLDSLTATGLSFGKCTLGYAPPEQMRNVKADIDSRADLFALGVTLYESATATNPFRERATEREMIQRIEGIPLPPLQCSFSTATEFAGLVVALTQKRRHHRPESAMEALVWMQEICEKERIR